MSAEDGGYINEKFFPGSKNYSYKTASGKKMRSQGFFNESSSSFITKL